MLCYEGDERVYYSENGDRYILLECVSMGAAKTSDIVTVFTEDEDGMMHFVTWFYGASCGDSFLLDACHDFIDSYEKREAKRNG